MKKIYPYIFPAVALLFVLFLLFRWYMVRTQREGMVSLLNDEVAIETLGSEAYQGLTGMGDYQAADLTDEDGRPMGEVRYEVVEDQLHFTVSTALPRLSSGRYQVWLRQAESEAQRKAFVLEYGKAGYTGSASIDAGTLPLEVIVSRETSDDAVPETVLLRGTMTAVATE